MKKINCKALFVTLILLACAVSVSAQEQPETKNKFDKKLAAKLGADEYGMRNYVLAILKTGPKDAEIKGAERDKAFAGHLANIKRIAAEGKLAVAGPFGKNDKQFRGLFIFAVDTVEEAEKLAATDPAIKAGILIVEFVPWYGSAALMEVNSVHEKIAEKSF